MLLTAHADAGVANTMGDSALHMVARQGLRSAEDVIKMLLDENADPTAVNNVRHSAIRLMLAVDRLDPQHARGTLSSAVERGIVTTGVSGAPRSPRPFRPSWPPPYQPSLAS